MKIVFNKNDYKSYKDFYVDVLLSYHPILIY